MKQENIKPKIVSIVGLTASGKSSIGIKLARMFDGEIVSCDSRQVYRGLDIGTGKVTKEEQAAAKHHMIDIADAGEHFEVFTFQKLAYAAIDDILARGHLPILVGGTGLYSRSIVQDYTFGKTAEPNPRYEVLQICLLPSREQIAAPIKKRLDERIAQGMIDETRALLARGVSRDRLSALGLEYFWNIEYIEGRVTMDEYKDRLYTKIMQFAKRQRTWFKKETNTIYLTDPDTFLSQCQTLTKEFLQKQNGG